MSIGRNDPCTCGSGRKYKHCCLVKTAGIPGFQKLVYLLIAVILMVSLVLIVRSIRTYEEGAGPTRVWSEEHQHWHTVD